MKPRMNVYITTAKGAVIYAYHTILSLFVNNQDSEIYLYIVSENLEESDIQNELRLAEAYGHHIIILRFDENMAKGKVQSAQGGHWPLGTLGCYWMFHKLLPEDVDRIMAIEADTVVLGSLRNFYNMELGGYYAACPDPNHKPMNHRNLMEQLWDVLTFCNKIKFVPAQTLRVDENRKSMQEMGYDYLKGCKKQIRFYIFHQ